MTVLPRPVDDYRIMLAEAASIWEQRREQLNSSDVFDARNALADAQWRLFRSCLETLFLVGIPANAFVLVVQFSSMRAFFCAMALLVLGVTIAFTRWRGSVRMWWRARRRLRDVLREDAAHGRLRVDQRAPLWRAMIDAGDAYRMVSVVAARKTRMKRMQYVSQLGLMGREVYAAEQLAKRLALYGSIGKIWLTPREHEEIADVVARLQLATRILKVLH